jgi:uncharacterized phiE125 gp8 family phage protein
MPTRISTSGAEPVTLAEAKLAARVDTSDLDSLIGGLITAAREQAEQITGRAYRPQVLREELADWPAVDDVIAVYAATACAVTYWNGSTWAALSGAAYVYAPDGNGTVLAPTLGTDWPTLPERAAGPRVRIDLTAGPAAPADVSEQVKLYIKASVSAWVNNPDAIGKPVTANPLFERLLDAERLY